MICRGIPDQYTIVVIRISSIVVASVLLCPGFCPDLMMMRGTIFNASLSELLALNDDAWYHSGSLFEI